MSEKQIDMFDTDENPIPAYVVKSMIQKAFRRNDQQMLEFAFNRLWKEDQKWVMWRVMVLPAEDGWKSVCELGRVVREVKTKLTSKNPAVAAKMGEKLLEGLKVAAAKEKNQDANGMSWLVAIVMKLQSTGSYKKRDELLGAINKKVTATQWDSFQTLLKYHEWVELAPNYPASAWNNVWDKVDALKEASPEYQDLRDTVGAVYFRAKMGGGADYQMLFLSASLLAIEAFSYGSYGLQLIATDSTEELLSDTFGNPRASLSNAVPWYCNDMHTGTGKRAIGYAAKKHEMDKQAIEDIWFVMETAAVNEEDNEALWWELASRAAYLSYGLKPDNVPELWKELGATLREKVIEWSK